MGGAFSPKGFMRSNYVTLLHRKHASRVEGLYYSWSELLRIMKAFVWSEKSFAAKVGEFWEECCVVK